MAFDIQAFITIAGVKGLDSARLDKLLASGTNFAGFNRAVDTSLNKVRVFLRQLEALGNAGVDAQRKIKDVGNSFNLAFGQKSSQELLNVAAALNKVFDNFKTGRAGLTQTRAELASLQQSLTKIFRATGVDQPKATARDIISSAKEKFALSGLDVSDLQNEVKSRKKFADDIRKATELVRARKRAFEERDEAERNRDQSRSVVSRFRRARSISDARDAFASGSTTDFGVASLQGAAQAQKIAEDSRARNTEIANNKQRASYNKLVQSVKKDIIELERALAKLNSSGVGGANAGVLRGRLQREIQGRRAAIGFTGSTTDDVTKLKQTTNELVKVKQAFDRNTLSAKGFGEAAALAFKRYSAFLIGTSAIFFISNAFRQGITSALEFEKNITRIQQVLELNNKTAEQIAVSIRNAARFSGESAAEIAAGVNIFAQAGFKDPADLGRLADTLAKTQLAPTFDDIGQTADGLLAVFGQFNKGLGDTVNVLDLVNQFAADFAVESKDIFEGVKRGGAAFSSAGGQLEDFISLFTLLRSATRESADTLGVFFKTGVAKLLTDKSQTILANLGVTAGPENLVQQLKQLSTITGNLQPVELIRLSEELVGERQFNRLITILQELGDPAQAERIKQALEKSTGSLDRSTQERLDDIGVSIARVTENFKAFITEITQSDAIKSLVTIITDLSNSLIELLRNIKPVLPFLGIIAGGAALNIGGRAAGGFFGRIAGLQPGLSNRERFGQFFGGINLRRSIIGGAGGAGLLAGELLRGSDNNAAQVAGSGLSAGGSAVLATSFLTRNPLTIGGAGTAAAVYAVAESLARLRTESIATKIELAKSSNRPVGGLTSVASDVFNFGGAGDLFTDPIEAIRRSLVRGIDRTNIGTSRVGIAVNDILNNDKQAQVYQDLTGAILDNVLKDVVSQVKSGNLTAPQGAAKIQSKLLEEFTSVFAQLGLDTNDPAIKSALGKFVSAIFVADPGLDRRIRASLSEAATVRVKQLANAIDTGIRDFGEAVRSLLGVVSNSVKRALEIGSQTLFELDNVATNPTDFGRLGLSPNRITALQQAGQGTIANNLQLVNSIAPIFADIFSNKEIRAALEASFRRSGQTESTLAAADDTSGVDIITSALSSLGATGEVAAKTINGLIEPLSAISGQTRDEILNALGDVISRGGSFVDFIDSLNVPLSEVSNKILEVVQSQIDIFNKEREVRRQLLESQRQYVQQLFEINTAISTATRTLQDRFLEQFQFLTNLDSIGRARQNAGVLIGRANQSSFAPGSQGGFINNLLGSFTDLSNIIKQVQERRSGNASLTEQQALLSSQDQAQERFLNLQLELGQRLSELGRRIDDASRASDLLKTAVIEFRNQLSSAGAAVTQFTVRDLRESFVSFERFISAGGLQNAGAGLGGLTQADFANLTRLLGALGNFNLGGGISGQSIQEQINLALGLPFLAQARSRITGEDPNTAARAITKEFETLRVQQRLAAELEAQLRQRQVQLLEAQARLASLQISFTVQQTSQIASIARNSDVQRQILTDIKGKVTQFLNPGGPPQLVKLLQDSAVPRPVDPLIDPPGPDDDDIRRPNSPFFNEGRDLSQTINNLNNSLGRYAESLDRLGEKLFTNNDRLSTFTLDVKPIQVNVALTAPDILALAGDSLYRSVIGKVAPAISNAFGVIGTEPRSVFEAGLT